MQFDCLFLPQHLTIKNDVQDEPHGDGIGQAKIGQKSAANGTPNMEKKPSGKRQKRQWGGGDGHEAKNE
ncbi:hypothetical protein niasHS_015726 [Heterodera schachtii]|uniref:Uncharacterized protein n=1 Tax=Heterodera schachtii TaxID=97005 RepID=A0ABD2HXE7_HETSC